MGKKPLIIDAALMGTAISPLVLRPLSLVECERMGKAMNKARDPNITKRNARLRHAAGTSYEITSAYRDGAFRSMLSAKCAKCGTTEEMKWDHGNEPQPINKRFHALGWDFDPFNAKVCVCARCRRASRKKQEEAEMAQSAKVVGITPGKPIRKEAGEHLQSVADIPPPQNAPPDPLGASHNRSTSPGRILTPEDRHRIRSLLDANFDDAAGHYLDGYSDQRVGAELDLPWASVRDIREAAYGPIRVDARVLQLREEVDALKRQLADIEGRLRALL